MRAKRMGWLLALLAMCGLAMAQRAYVAIEQRLSEAQLREVGLSPAQLDLLNRYLRQAEQDAPAVEGARYAAAEGAPRPDATRVVGLDAERIATRVKGMVAGWEPGSVFVLANGQQWKVLKGEVRLRTALESPEVVVVPGVAGRWFLQVVEDMPKARVYRID